MNPSTDHESQKTESQLLPYDESVLEGSVIDRFEAVVTTFASHEALVTDSGSQSYEDLNRSVNRLAWSILDHTPAQDVPVAVLLDLGPEAVTAMMAILKTGHMYTVLDTRAPITRMSAILADAGTALIVTDEAHLDTVREVDPEGAISLLIIDQDSLSPREENLNRAIKPGDLLGIYYSSGSTGEPKGIMFDHRQILMSVQAFALQDQIGPGDRLGLMASLAFGMSTVTLYSALLTGAALSAYRSQSGALDEVGEWITRERLTVVHPPISLFRRFAMTRSPDDYYPNVRLVLLGGDVLFRDDIVAARPYFPTECTFVSQFAAHEAMITARYRIEHDTPMSHPVLPVGFAVPSKKIRLIDEDGKTVKAGELGEITITSRGLSPGYWKQPDLTQATFKQDASDATMRTWHSGDLGQLDDEGRLSLKGRKDLAVKIRGYRVTVGEIELALRRYDGISDAAVWVHPDHLGEKRLVAYFVPETGTVVTPADLRDWLGDLLPEYMVPSFWVEVTSLPMTITNKVNRKLLPPPDMSRPDLAVEFVGARDGLEQQLVGIWEKVLGIKPLGIYDNFFDLGGHSVLALHLVTEIQEVLGVELAVDTLLETGTIATMAELIEKGIDPKRRKTIVVLNEGDGREPLTLVHPRGGTLIAYNELLRYLDPAQPVSGIQARGLQGEGRPFDDIREMAAWYVQKLQEAQPEGPFYLGGYSMGGLIAFEVALQLEAAGRSVRLVWMLDTVFPGLRTKNSPPETEDAPRKREKPPTPSKRQTLKERVQRALQEDSDELRALDGRERLTYIGSRIGHFWNWYVVQRVYRAMGRGDEFHERGWSPTRLAKTLHLRASQKYRAKGTIQADVVYMNAQFGTLTESYDHWKRHVAGKFTISNYEASHRGLLLEPDVKAVAAEITAILNKLYEQAKERE